MSRVPTNRRDFLKVLGLAAAGGAVACPGPGEPGPAPTPDPTPVPPGTKVRRDVNSLDPDGPEITAYKMGVQAMKGRPDANPLGWVAQARIHLDWCPHGNWFFLPWHRAYLYYFEQVCRAASGDQNFTLPYWNWTANPQIPAAFWGQGNPLFNSTRTAGPNSTASPEFVGQTVVDGILAINDFELFASSQASQQRQRTGTGRLEGTPHNYVHGFVGGEMGTFWSPLDPIFWLHHANVDRLWATWNESHANTTDLDWLNFTFQGNFVDTSGNPVDVQVEDVLSTVQLGYRYDTQPETIGPESLLLVSAGTVRETVAAETRGAAVFGREPLSVPLAPDTALHDKIRALTAPQGERPRATLRLAVEGVDVPEDPRTAVRVFLNCDYLSPDTPIDDPHYVGTFTFFHDPDAPHEGHVSKGSYLFNAAETLRKLRQQGQYQPGAPVQVQVIPVPLDGDPGLESVASQAVAPSGFSLSYVEYR